jgi:tetratricopeptide (TPR) repeat protein
MNLRLLDDAAAAATQFQHALAIEPDRPMSLVHLGWISMEQRQYANARRWLDSAVAVNPGFYQAYAERASLRLVTGDTAGARADAATAVRLRPESDLLAGEDVLLALDLRSGNTTGARARLNRLRPAIERSREPGVHRAVAWAALLVATGEDREAIDFLEQVRIAPTHLWIHLNERRFDAVREDPRFQRLLAALRVREAVS